MPDFANDFWNLLISLGLGLLIGMQRERTKPRLGGIRTFALIAIFGSLCAMLTSLTGGWAVAAGLLGVTATAAIGNLFALREGRGSPGVTTEIAMLATFGVGALVPSGHREVAIAIGAGIAILLNAKPVLHGVVAKLGDQDVRAIMQFALITLIILPVLPNETFGPFDVLNPHNIWLMVVLVVGMSLGGYLVYRFIGETAGLPLAGILGGLISSTATTVSYSRRAAENPKAVPAAVAIIMIAGTVVYGRVLVEIGVTAPSLLPHAAGPVLTVALTSVILAVVAWRRTRNGTDGLGDQKNPTELKSALVFGGIYAAVLLAVAAAKHTLGDKGLYAVALVSGLTDMDAITLSSSRLVSEGQIEPGTAWRAIILAAASNNVFKTGVVGALGGWRLLKPVATLVAIKLAVVAAVLVFWP
ncbi:MAG: MgtC/SapB family protein [Phycisphaeraceae bacterium]|nr:MgtC/SapB family protein [Phycisphaeraceae bacterium]